MTHSRSEKPSVDHILSLVSQLSEEQQEQVRLRLNRKGWGAQWDELSQEIQARSKEDGLALPTEEEVLAEVKAVRAARKAKRADRSG